MELYLYSVEMPFSGKKIFYRELNSKDQIMLSKANTMLPPGEEFAEDYARVLREIVSGCVQNKEDFYQLNILEYIMFLTKLRIASLGEEIEVVINDPNRKEEEPIVKMVLNLSNFIKNLYKIAEIGFETKIIELDLFKIKLNWPNCLSENLLIDKEGHSAVNSFSEYIENFIFNGKEIKFNSLNSFQKNEIYDKIPVKITTLVNQAILKAVNNLSETNLFNVSVPLQLNYYNFSHHSVLRLFFTENLKHLYQEYFVLASRHLPPNYIDSLTVGERKVYFSFLEKSNESESNDYVSEEIWANTSRSSAVDQLAREYGQL